MRESQCKSPCKYFEASSNFCLLHWEFLLKFPHFEWPKTPCNDFKEPTDEN